MNLSRPKSLVTLAILLCTLSVLRAEAGSTSEGIPLTDGPLFQTATLWLDLTEAGSGLGFSAVGRVETITSTGSVTLWQSGPETPELTFRIGDFSPISEVTLPGGLTLFNFEGGALRFYADPSRNTYAKSPLFTASNFDDGSLFLDLRPRGDSTNTTLTAVVSTDGNGPSFISASGNFDVVGGVAATFFDTNWNDAGGATDLIFSFSASFQPSAFGWDYRGIASGSGSSVVPLPASLLLMASAMTAALGLRRRPR
jgi:hypothetical protein